MRPIFRAHSSERPMNSRTVPDDPVTRGDTFLEKLLPIAFHAKIVRHREHAAHRIGLNPSLILVAPSGNHPLERHLTASYDDVDRGTACMAQRSRPGLPKIVRYVVMRIPSPIEESGKTAVRGSILHDEQQPTSPRIL